MNSTGLPQYAADSYDSARTHPACSSPVPLMDNGLPFGESDTSAVTHDLQRAATALSPLAAEYPPGLGIEPEHASTLFRGLRFNSIGVLG